MRKLFVALLSVSVVAGIATGIASGAGHRAHAAAPKCGTLYTPPCAPPGAVFSSLAACKAAGTLISVPVKLHAVAGIKSASMYVNGHKVKTYTYKNHPRNVSIGDVPISTRGLKPGLYTMTVKVTDVRGVTRSHTGHFAICKPKPVFTG